MASESSDQIVEPCTCGHAKSAHEHYRRGSDCALCPTDGCAKYRAATSPAAVVMPVNPVQHS